MSLCSHCSLPGVYLYSKDTQVSVIKETKLPVGVNGLCTDVCVCVCVCVWGRVCLDMRQLSSQTAIRGNLWSV